MPAPGEREGWRGRGRGRIEKRCEHRVLCIFIFSLNKLIYHTFHLFNNKSNNNDNNNINNL